MSTKPEFVVGDTRKALRVELRDSDGAAVNATGGQVRLFARAANSGNKPTSVPGEPTWNGVLGVWVSAAGGVADFQGLGGLLSLGTGRLKDTYRYRVKFIDSGGAVSWSTPENEFTAAMPPS